MARFLLSHRHQPRECRFAFAAWHGFRSPLRRTPTVGTCHAGGHELWWEVEADDEAGALAQLPPYLAERTDATELREVEIP
jgi:hypothetical protein